MTTPPTHSDSVSTEQARGYIHCPYCNDAAIAERSQSMTNVIWCRRCERTIACIPPGWPPDKDEA